MPDRLTTAYINLKHYKNNFNEIKKLVHKKVKVMAVIKANAYGHGIEEIAKYAEIIGFDYLGLVSLGELKSIRKAGVVLPALILNYLDPNSLTEAIQNSASITIFDKDIIHTLEKQSGLLKKITKVHIKVDTGLHRAGCDPENLLEIAIAVNNSPHLKLEGLFTHFAESENDSPEYSKKQLNTFIDCIKILNKNNIKPTLLHCANSAAIANFPEAHFDMVRAGLLSYGLNPFSEGHPRFDYINRRFKPVLSLKTQIVFLRNVLIGETVGYNRSWTAQRDSVLALLPVGYGDGYRRGPFNANKVIINGQFVPIVGSVSMDQTVIDVTDIKGKIKIGDEVVLLGEQDNLQISANDIAESFETINYEVLTSLMNRIDRVYITEAD